MAKTKEERLREVHSRAMAEFNRIQAALRDERMQCLQDRRFYSISGAQWEGPLAEQFDNKPRFEINKTHLAVIRIFNEYRNNRITVDFEPKDGEDADELADTCDALFRADMEDSCGEEALDNCFEEKVGGGIGAFRLRACYEDEEDEENEAQRIRFEPIYDADSSVFFDLDAKRYDKSDATKCFVIHSRERQAYIDEYGDDPGQWPREISLSLFDWSTPDLVHFAEYYEVEEVNELLRVFRGIDDQDMTIAQSELDDEEGKLDMLLATGFREVRQKRVKRRRVHKYILGASRVLEDEGYIAGPNIPIIVDYGKRWFVDGVERCMGHVRLAKDTQRLVNMQRSKLGEIAALSSVEKPIVTPEQIAGHELLWREDNVKNYPYLLLNAQTDADGNPVPGSAAPTAYTKSPAVPPAMAALLAITEQDLKDLLGDQAAGEKIVSNIAEKTVEMIQQRLDMQTYIYISNTAKALRRAGEVWLGMARELYVDEGRKMRALSADGETVSTVELMQPIIDPKTGEQRYANDLRRAKYAVSVQVGPTSSSKRSATVRSLTNLLGLTQDQQTQQILMSMIMANLEGEGMTEVRKWFRGQLVRMGVVKPTDEEAQALQNEAANARPDPQAQYLQAAAEQAQADAADARAATILKIAQAEKSRADTAKTLAEIDTEETQRAIATAEALRQAAAPSPGLP